VFRWIGCSCLLLGITAELSASPYADAPKVNRKTQIASSTFGTRVEFGKDGSVNVPPKAAPQDVVGADHSVDSTKVHSTKTDLANWQEPTHDFGEMAPLTTECAYEWQVLPVGLMYKTYLAGEKESRMQAVWFASQGRPGIIWETTLGGHVGLLRYGTTDAINPEGWQFDLEGAAMPRVDLQNNSDLESADFRAGFLSTWRSGANAYKVGYYHLSSHLGDEFMIRNPGYTRLNYVRDSAIVGYTRNLTPDIQAYGEVAYAFNHEDGAEPLELQYGLQYSPMVFGLHGAPFAAINGHTRQDFGYITSVNIAAGWQWRGYSNHTYRIGVQYYKGPAMQWEFAGRRETLAGAGMWMDY
jgi:hypothetical protein